jgi:hypothetical protein
VQHGIRDLINLSEQSPKPGSLDGTTPLDIRVLRPDRAIGEPLQPGDCPAGDLGEPLPPAPVRLRRDGLLGSHPLDLQCGHHGRGVDPAHRGRTHGQTERPYDHVRRARGEPQQRAPG